MSDQIRLPPPEAISDYDGPQFAAGSVVGWRIWGAYMSYDLYSVGVNYVWTGAEETAQCLYNMFGHHHHIVSKKCGCGFYAYYQRRPYNDYGVADRAHLEGLIEGSGRCILGSKGFRAEKVRILAFIHPYPFEFFHYSDKTPNAFAEHYEVPIYTSFEAATQEFPLGYRP